ncbi:glutathione S-transferase T1 [Lactuca sativa]|uniref:glutathione transferase n=1 Tax=Lactuca sativa TaxID=4236 RepID=A0A9R1X7K6_LACSA|nr:glutathione S-transferase T1 [Lactuca sativa]KAJ0200554.1 hypothetical protein LSAT_V11C600301380 [Lactuca sativa]
MVLKVYADRLSQPSRSVLLFCKVIGIDFEEIQVEVLKNQRFSPEYKAINPMSQVPAIVDGHLKLFESHAILIYLSCSFPGVANNWYPSDVSKRAKIHSVLDWHHSNLHRGSVGLILNTIMAPKGFPSSPQAAKEAEKILMKSLNKLETFWLKDGSFLVGSSKPSIADISLVCDIMQLQLLSDKDFDRILSPYKKVVEWIQDTISATAPHFHEVHGLLFKAQKRIRGQMATQTVSALSKI